MFRVYEDGKLCDWRYHDVHESWIHPVCDTFEEAQEYCRKWLGQIHWRMTPTTPNTPVDFSGYGSIIEIREIN